MIKAAELLISVRNRRNSDAFILCLGNPPRVLEYVDQFRYNKL